MFPYDERAAVLEQCRQSSKKDGLALDSAVELWNYFVDKTREVCLPVLRVVCCCPQVLCEGIVGQMSISIGLRAEVPLEYGVVKRGA